MQKRHPHPPSLRASVRRLTPPRPTGRACRPRKVRGTQCPSLVTLRSQPSPQQSNRQSPWGGIVPEATKPRPCC